MRRVDAEVRAVGVVAEDLVDDAHRAVVAGDVATRRRPAASTRERSAAPVERLEREDVLGELVDGIAAGRRRLIRARSGAAPRPGNVTSTCSQ